MPSPACPPLSEASAPASFPIELLAPCNQAAKKQQVWLFSSACARLDSWDTLVAQSCKTLLWDLVGRSCKKTLVGHFCRTLSCGTLLWGTFAGPSCFLNKIARQVSKTNASYETSSKNHASSLQNERDEASSKTEAGSPIRASTSIPMAPPSVTTSRLPAPATKTRLRHLQHAQCTAPATNRCQRSTLRLGVIPCSDAMMRCVGLVTQMSQISMHHVCTRRRARMSPRLCHDALQQNPKSVRTEVVALTRAHFYGLLTLRKTKLLQQKSPLPCKGVSILHPVFWLLCLPPC